ncbi:MAG: ribonuclease Y [Patescibacteria group bacterium]
MLNIVLTAIAGVLVGGILGFVLFKILSSKKVSKAKLEADKIIERAKTEEKEILLVAKDEALKEKEEAKKTYQEKEKYLEKTEMDLRKRELSIDTRFDELDKSQKELTGKEKQIEDIKQALRDLRKKQEESLERIAKMNKDDAKKVLLELAEREGKEDLVKKLKEVDTYVKDNVDDKVKRIMVTAMQRLASETASETTIATIQLPNEEMKGRIIGKEGRNIQAFEKTTGVDVIIDDTPEAVVLSTFDPIRRQVARVTLAELISDGRIHPTSIEAAFEKAKKIVSADIKKSGEEACYEVGVTGLPQEIMQILGRLKFRTSFGQNQLDHSIEVARIGGLLADELGADVFLTKKACLLHDLGKAIDHEVPGSHAIISADIARKFKLSADLIHAIEAHHTDVEPETVEAILVQVADAISASRPGSRRESFELYIKRLEELERVANSFSGVEKSYAVQAGREVRVIVIPTEIDDLVAAKMAKDIAKKIEEEVQYPGQVKVTVIRETRAVEVAR